MWLFLYLPHKTQEQCYGQWTITQNSNCGKWNNGLSKDIQISISRNWICYLIGHILQIWLSEGSWDGVVTLYHPRRPQGIARVLIRERRECKSQRRCDNGRRGRRGAGPRAMECGSLYKSEKARKGILPQTFRRNIDLTRFRLLTSKIVR